MATCTSSLSLENRYKDKVVIITGGGRGIGEGIARVFAKASSKVVITDIRPEPDWLIEVNSTTPGEISYIQCDVSKEEEVKNLIAKVIDKHAKIDCVVNNAGVKHQHMPVDQIPTEEYHRIMNVNVFSCYLLSKYSLPHLRKVQGNIIFIASMTGKMGQLYASVYSASKGAMLAFARGLAIDEAKYHVRVNSICPGNVFTPMWLETLSGNCTEKEIAEIKQTADEAQLLGHMGTVEDIGLACLYLADAPFVTGIDMNLSGGAELDFGFKTRVNQEEVFRWVALKKQQE